MHGPVGLKLSTTQPIDKSARPFLTALWRRFVVLNYEIDPAVLRPYVPRGTELDDYHGRHLASVVGFMFQRARLIGLPVPLHQSFPEVNLRINVRREVDGTVRRGVVFLCEMVPRRAVVWTANRIYGESFIYRPMRARHDSKRNETDPTGWVEYDWRDADRWSRLAARPAGAAHLPTPGSEEAFIVEHYLAYSGNRNGWPLEYFVDHRPWRIWPAAETVFDCDIASLYGPQFVEALSAEPSSAFLADGSAVGIYPGRGTEPLHDDSRRLH